MVHCERDGKDGQLISNSSDPRASQEFATNCASPGIWLYRWILNRFCTAEISEAQANLLQLAGFQLEVTVLRSPNLPRLKTLLGKKKRFYVTVTDGYTTNLRKTTAIRSVGQAVEWKETLDGFPVSPSSPVTLSLYAQESMGKDRLIGTQEIPLESQNDISFDLGNVDNAQRVTLVLTINLSANPHSTATAAANAANIVTTRVFAEPALAVASVALNSTNATSAEAEVLSALHLADDALKVMKANDKWENAVERVQWVMDAVGPVAELHPYAQMAWGLLSTIPKTFLQQVQRDENIENLLDAMHDAFEFVEEAGPLKNINPESNQAKNLTLTLQQVCNCSDFIKSYAEDTEFRERFLKNIGGSVDKQICDFCAVFVQLRKAFLDHTAVATAITALQILDDVDKLSSQLSELDMDENLREIPYKGGWCSNIKRDYLLGTRTAFLDYIAKWADDPSSKRGLVLFGQAGTGKSSIAHEVARRFQHMNRLSSYFIFFRAEQSKGNDYLVFTTIVHDLANRFPSFKIALGKVIKNNKSLRATQHYHTLFESLLLQPLKDLHTVGPILIIIEALDESGDVTGKSGLHTFLAECLAKLPPNFRILITSRREVDIELAFPNTAEAPYEIVYMDDLNLAARTYSDIRLYLQQKLPLDTFNYYGDKLVKKAEGLFQWAAVASGYINAPPDGLTQNDCIRALLNSSVDHEGLGQKLAPLYKLYKQVLDGYFEAEFVQRRFQSVMGQLLASLEPLSVDSLTTLRRYPLGNRDDDDSIIAIIRRLGSLLSNVTSDDRSLPIVPLHTSFHDFLTDEKMSGAFYINRVEAHRQLAHSCLGLMLDPLHGLQFNICKLESSYLSNTKISDLRSRIDKYIPPALFYACRFCSNHTERIGFEHHLLSKLQLLFEEKFLFWLEVFSLTGTVGLATSAMSSVTKWLASGQPEHSEACRDKLRMFQDLINDSSTFLRYFGMVIAKSAPHIYISALPFAPSSSQVYRRFSSIIPNTLSVKRGQLSQWPAGEIVIDMEQNSITSVALSRDGQWIVSGSRDGTIRVWNATTGAMEGSPFTGNTGSVHSVAFSQDGQRIISVSGSAGGTDGMTRTWNVSTGALEESPFARHTGLETSVPFWQDGQRILSRSSDGTIHVWDAITGAMEGSPLHTGRVRSLSSFAISRDGRRFASGSHDGTIRVWNAMTGAMEGNPFTGHTSGITSIAFSQDGQRIVSASSDFTIHVWNATTGVMEGSPFTGHSDVVTSVAFWQDGERIVSASYDSTIRVWNTTTRAMEFSPFVGHIGPVISLAFSQDGQRIVAASSDGSIRVWKATMGAREEVMEGTPELFTKVQSAAFSQDGQRVVSASSNGTICVRNATTGVMEGSLGPFTGPADSVMSIAFSHDESQIVYLSSSHGTMSVWNTTMGANGSGTVTRIASWDDSVAFSQDGERFVSGSHDGVVRVWNTTTGAMERSLFTGHRTSVTSVAFSQDRQWIASGSHDGTVQVWNATTGAMEGSRFTGHTSWINSVAFSQDWEQTRIVSGSNDGTIRVWNASTGAMEGSPFIGHASGVTSAAFSQDWQRIVSGSSDGTIRVWTTTGAMEGSPFSGHTGVAKSVTSVAFSRDGQRILSLSDGIIYMWNAMRGETVIAEQANFSDQSTINSEGWICGSEDELLVWIPHIHRSSLHHPSNIWVSGEHETRLDLSRFVHGSKWATCHHHSLACL